MYPLMERFRALRAVFCISCRGRETSATFCWKPTHQIVWHCHKLIAGVRRARCVSYAARKNLPALAARLPYCHSMDSTPACGLARPAPRCREWTTELESDLLLRSSCEAMTH